MFASTRRAVGLSARQFRREQIDLLNVRWGAEQGSCVGHQCSRNRASQVGLTTFLVRKGVENAKRLRAELQRKPSDGAQLGIGERQCAGQEGGDGGLLAGLGFETDKQGKFGHGMLLLK